MAKSPKIKTVNRKLQERAVRHSVFLGQYSNAEVRKIIEFLNVNVERDLVNKLAKYAGDEKIEKRVAQLRKEIKEVCQDGYKELGVRLQKDLTALGKKEALWQGAMLAQAFPFDLQVNAIWLGIAEGEGISDIIRRVRGTRQNKYKDGVMSASRREVESVVRTAVMGVSNNVRQETYAANADIIKGIEWVATLEIRSGKKMGRGTCLRCAALDGQVFPLDEGPRPPLHWNCRCSITCVTKSWKELGIKKIKELPEGTRASMDGQVPGGLSFGDWLRSASKGEQEYLLGKKRAALFRAGKLRIEDFTDDRNQVLTLAQLGKTLGVGVLSSKAAEKKTGVATAGT